MQMSSEYSKSSVDSIYQFAKLLTGKSLNEVSQIPIDAGNTKSRGNLGSLVERYFFKHLPPNTHHPDFEEVGLELKTTGLVRDSKGKLKAKERLVLTMIHYESIAKEEWESSNLLQKCQLMLILFYLYQKDKPAADLKFPISPLLYRMPEIDVPIIRRDWEFIRQRVLDGRAHELSEGDTFYLGACRKGSGGEDESLQSQPFSNTKAKTRAFSFKQSYMNKLIEGHIDESGIIQLGASDSLYEATFEKLKPFLGKSLDEISRSVDYYRTSTNQKGFKHSLIVRLLSNGRKSAPELDKAGIEIKTITLTQSGKPKEHMSFPGFRFMDIIQQEWEDSSFNEKIERKFLFVVFKLDERGEERLFRFGYWNMPYKDRLEAQRVWEETKSRVLIDAKDLPKVGESYLAHVRPKARDGSDKIRTPQGEMHLKQCFWLNQNYLHKVVFEDLS
jgi:DNA mismatch repair protein MutH